MLKQWRFWLGSAISLLILGLSLSVLYHLGDEYHWRDINKVISDLPVTRLACAMGFTLCSYFLLTLYDTLAVKQVGGNIPYPKIALTSFIAYTFSNTLGFALLTGTSVRYRFYSALGLTTSQIAKIIFFCSVTFFLGMFLVGGLSLTFGVTALPAAMRLPLWIYDSIQLIGVVAILAVCAYLVLPLLRREPLHLMGHSLAIPKFTDTFRQLLVAVLDWMMAAAVCYILLPAAPGLSYWHVLSVFVIANMLGVLAHVPGGIGVFESVFSLLLTSVLPAPQVLGALILYRLVYYIFPFFMALSLFSGVELLRHRQRLAYLQQLLANFRQLIPALVSLGAFAAGTLLLFSGATPEVKSRIDWLLQILPLPLLELSHLMGSISGVLLLLLARSLYRRYDSAFRITQVLLLAGILFSLMKGADWEEASFLCLLFVGILPCKDAFYRRGSLIHTPFTSSWFLAFTAVLVGVVWLLLISFRHVDYTHALWWHFASNGMASRALRATGIVIGVAAAAGFAALLRPTKQETAEPQEDELNRAAALTMKSGCTHGHLAQLRDKTLLFHESGEAFLMYAVEGSSWVVMGDPIGDPERFDELLWQFREMCDEHDGNPVFYQVSAKYLPEYLELGLMPFKLGEEAIIELAEFSLASSKMRNLRQSHARAVRDGLSFEVIPANDVVGWLPKLTEISDAWLTSKQGREKGFSVGRFDERYLMSGPVALVRYQDKLVGFANLWTTEGKEELSVDLMRYHAEDSLVNVMDYLFTELLLWGKAQGFHHFNMGMAPMSGFADHPLAPFWGKLGQTLYVRGNRFYNFQGLRRYKEKYHPEWQPRYLLCPGGIGIPLILTNLVSLISRGPLGVMQK